MGISEGLCWSFLWVVGSSGPVVEELSPKLIICSIQRISQKIISDILWKETLLSREEYFIKVMIYFSRTPDIFFITRENVEIFFIKYLCRHTLAISVLRNPTKQKLSEPRNRTPLSLSHVTVAPKVHFCFRRLNLCESWKIYNVFLDWMK